MPPVRPHSRRRRFIEQDTRSLRAFVPRSLVHIRVWRKRKRVHLSTVRVRREGDQIRPCPHSLTRGRGNRPKPDFRPTVWEGERGRERNKGSTEREGGSLQLRHRPTSEFLPLSKGEVSPPSKRNRVGEVDTLNIALDKLDKSIGRGLPI